jgi:DnaK suppressor protein
LRSTNKFEHFKRVLEARIEEASRVLANAEKEQKATSARHADEGDQATAEYERQTLSFKAAGARQTLSALQQALERMRQGTFGECAQCGSYIERKRLEAIPWARYCVKCQEAREQR